MNWNNWNIRNKTGTKRKLRDVNDMTSARRFQFVSIVCSNSISICFNNRSIEALKQCFSLPFLLFVWIPLEMPKTWKLAHEWKKRLEKFAWGVQFGRGERPRKNSTWARELVEIEKCSRHGGAGTTNLWGRRIVCKCDHHRVSIKNMTTVCMYVYMYVYIYVLKCIWVCVHSLIYKLEWSAKSMLYGIKLCLDSVCCLHKKL